MGVDSTWSVLASAVLEVASLTIGFKRYIQHPWMSESTFDILEKKAVAHGWFRSAGSFKGCSMHGLNWTTRRTTTDWLMRHRKESTGTICTQHSAKSKRSEAGGVRRNQHQSRNRWLCLFIFWGDSQDGHKVFLRWQEHFESILNYRPATLCPELVAVASQATTDVSVVTDSHHFSPFLGRFSHVCCSDALNRFYTSIAALSSLASHPAGQPLMQSWP